MTTIDSPPKLNLDALGRIILHAEPEALFMLLGIQDVSGWRRLDTQLENVSARRLPDLYYRLDTDAEPYATVIEVQVRSRSGMAHRWSDIADLLDHARSLNPAEHPQPVVYVELRLRQHARQTVGVFTDSMGRPFVWTVNNLLTRRGQLPDDLRGPRHAAVEALVRYTTLDELRRLVAAVEASDLDPRVKHTQLLLLGLVGRAIYDEEVIQMSAPMQIQTVDELEREGRADAELTAYYEAMLAERDRLAREQGERIGIEKGERAGIKKGERIGIEKGERIGIEKGERIGIEKGRLAERRAMLLSLLDRRRLDLSRDQRDRINGCDDLDRLGEWFDRAIDAADVGDVFD